MIYSDIEFPDNTNEDRIRENENEDVTKNILLSLSNNSEIQKV